MKYIITLLLAVVSIHSSQALAATTPLAVTTITPVQFPPSDFNIIGARVGLLGHHRNMYGIDVGALGNITDQDFVGIAVAGLFNLTRGSTLALGLQGAGIANINGGKTRVVGLQIAGLTNINHTESSVIGLQIAPLANLSSFTKIYGVQASLINKAHTVYGFQIGLYNYAEKLHGIQIGLINVHRQGFFGISPIINIGF